MLANATLEFPALSEALYYALTDDIFYRVLEENVDCSDEVENKSEAQLKTRKSAMLAYLDYSIQESQLYGECFIPKGENYGVSVWSKPLNQELSNEKTQRKCSFIEKYMGSNCLLIYQNACREMEQQSKPLIPEDSWYLSIIGISPDYQGQGLGPGLVEPILEKTDSIKVGSYLETFTARNKSFYLRLGYQVIAQINQPTIGGDYWLMYREAKQTTV